MMTLTLKSKLLIISPFNEFYDISQDFFKVSVCYFLSDFCFSLTVSPSKTMKNNFYFIQKALFVLDTQIFVFSSPRLFFPVSHYFIS